ncbi:type A von Willebrand factor domain-containing protein [Cavenderia fasciculata]|uniref:Type A von Willebrand factor domain-containing protein n=1 Tax=Cavenderia fasciculata TaxID=261658 RepID=F4Q3L5_CACFS|nr:type A von Willebrand factor domain-containing protein [Cavenderia fasciculata]EGG17673.1 type A von Willebrand factor domain-containing protein [Cavenderia fasciculata]|eukprot:XP_004356157.1 type A von Willebrand factor domain-containing protein [Cavenderia fasciculata]
MSASSSIDEFCTFIKEYNLWVAKKNNTSSTLYCILQECSRPVHPLAIEYHVVVVILLVFACVFTQATHFRFGSISWAPLSQDNYNVINVKLNLAFRSGYWSSSSIRVGNTISSGTGTITSGNGGSVAVPLVVNTINTVDGWFTGTAEFQYTYPKGKNATYTIVYTGNARISTLYNNADKNWRLTSSVTINTWKQNSSPVTNTYPIIPVVTPGTNTFQIVATDAESSTLTYSLSEPSEFGGGSKCPNLTVSNSGLVTFTTGIKPSLFNTQIKISDGTDFTVTDFILQSDYGSINAEPPYFAPPTPDDGDVLFVQPGTNISLTYLAKSNTSSQVFIKPSNVPYGVTQYAQAGLNPGTMNSWWVPTASNVGRYVISLGLSDKEGLSMTGQSSFVLVVESPSCGHGRPCNGADTSCCVCDGNWDNSTKCFECKEGFYGPDCIPTPPCKNGTVNGGVAGDGSCQCYSGYTGSACDTPISKRCAASDPSAVVSTASNDNSFVNPTLSSVYVSTTSKTAFNVPIKVTVPSPLPALDVYVLLDVATRTSTITSDFINYIDSFVNLVGGNVENVRFGYGRFSDATNGGYNFQAVNTIGTTINDFIKTTAFTTTTTTSGNSMVALYNAALNSNGWRQGSFRVILVVTDNDAVAPTTANSNLYMNALAQNSIMPVVLGTGSSSLTNWNAFFSAAGFGYSLASGTGSAWASNAATLASVRSYSKIVTRVTNDADGFATAKVADVTTASLNTINVPVVFPTADPSNNPTVEVSFIGFGKSSMNIVYNHAPVAMSSIININEDTVATFSFASTVSDPDFNILTISFNSLPTKGSIKYNGAAATTTGVYPSAAIFTYTPNANYFGADMFSYSVNDGCLVSGSTGLITVNPVNDPPTCNAYGITSNGGQSSAAFTLTGSDIDNEPSELFIIYSSLANIASYGTLKTVAGAAVVAGTKYVYGTQFIFTQTFNGADTVTTVPFVIHDGELPSSSSCSLTINMKHTNVAPVLSAPLSVTSNAGSEIIFGVTAEDSDSTTIQFSVVSVTPGTGYFYLCGTSTKITAAVNVGTPITLANNKALTQAVCYHIDGAQPNGLNVASVVFGSADNQGLPSNTVTVQVNVAGTRNNAKPVATPVTVPALYEDGLSVAIVLNGTDADTLDQGNLRAVYTAPSKGQLIVAAGGAVAAADGKAPYTVYYKPNALFYGTDSFTFYVYDTMGAVSDSVTVTLTVIHVNHPPTLPSATLSFTQLSHPLQSLTPNDVDVGDVLTCYVVSLPTTGQVTDSSSVAITSVASPVVLSTKQFSAKETPANSIDPYTTTFKAKCCDQVGACSPDTTMTIVYKYINQAPVALQTNASCDQDSSVTFNFNYTDDKPLPATIKLVTLPTNGVLLVNNVVVSSTDTILPTDNVVYRPNAGKSNDDTIGFAGPLDTISFSVIDSDSLYSQQPSTATFYVAPRKPPTYTGLNELNTNEDTTLNFIVEGAPPRGQSNFDLVLGDIEGRGQLSYYVCDEPECLRIAKKGDTFQHDTKYPFIYTPLANDNGNAIFNLSFTLVSEQQVSSDTVKIVINVLPVNDPPTIVLNDFTIVGVEGSKAPLTNVISFPMNQSIIMSWSGYDIDSPNNTLVCTVASLKVAAGSFYTYNASNSENGFVGSKLVRGSSLGTYDAVTNLWHAVFVPTEGRYGNGFAGFSFSLVDDQLLASPPSTVTINVESVNQAPSITLKQASFTGVEQTDIVITGVTFRDPDSNINNVSLVISVVNANQELVKGSSISFFGNVEKEYCVNETNKITCVEDQDTLNALIKTITVHNPTTGNIFLNVFVDDLGYNAPIAKRNVSHLTATENVALLVSSKPTSKTTNTTVLSAAIAGAVAGAAILVAGAWKFLKKSVPPTSAFFGDSPFSDGAISSNPLYQESGNAGVNPFYEASSA